MESIVLLSVLWLGFAVFCAYQYFSSDRQLPIFYQIMLLMFSAVLIAFFLASVKLHWTISAISTLIILALVFVVCNRFFQNYSAVDIAMRQLASGKMDKIEIEKNHGASASIIANYNNHVDHLLRTVKFAENLERGVLSDESETFEAKDALGKALNSLQNHMQDFVAEMNTVATSASEEGTLSARIDEETKSGIWLGLSQSINNLLISFSNPLKELNVIINGMAGGDLTMRYTSEAKGDILRMANHLNLALDNLDGLLNQIMVNANNIDEASKEMNSASEEMNGSTNEIASAIAQMSAGSHRQMDNIDESSNLLEGILSTSNEMVKKSETINEVAKRGVEKSESGMTIIHNVVNSMNEIADFSSKTNDSIQVLADRSKEIEKVLSVIAEIAGQTNLLALNAAIEAAQAGEAGRGFAVVAEEIRKLAEDSKKSANEIDALVQSVKKDTSEATSVMDSMNQSVSTGVDTASQAAEAFESLNQASTDTLASSEVILKSAKVQIDDIRGVVGIIEGVVVIAQQSSAGTEEVASSAAELSSGMEGYNEKAQILADIADNLKNGLTMVKLSGNAKENTAIFKMKEAYEKEKYLLDALLNHSPDFIYFKDVDSKFVRNSMSHIVRLGHQRQEDIVGLCDFDFHGDHAQKAFDDEQDIIKTGEPLLNHVQKVDLKNGNLKYLSTTKMPLLDLNGDIVGTFGISRDVTESKLAEINAKKQAAELAEREKELMEAIERLNPLESEVKELRAQLASK